MIDATLPTIAGTSPAIRHAVGLVDRFARSQMPILVVGDTGTGKELIAERVHAMSGRRGELVDVNCGALPGDMIESLLFGHLRGSFTGAIADSPGLIQRAHGGTLFLDELSSLPLTGQAKLLRVLETRTLRRVGDGEKRAVDFRLVAAVQENVGLLVERGTFRLDLAQRVSGVVIELLPLASRLEDIAPLAHYFAATHGCALDTDAVRVLMTHSWPGNVRELKVTIERAAIGSGRHVLTAEVIVEAMPAWALGSAGRGDASVIIRACAEANWDAIRAAELLGISRATLYRRLKRHRLALGLCSRTRNLIPC